MVFNTYLRFLIFSFQVAWEMVNAPTVIERKKKSRLEILQELQGKACDDQCGGNWKIMAEETLERNHVTRKVFCQAVYNLLEQGRGKYRNILLTGPANCGKTFILLPLTVIYECFANPATNTFAWVGAEKAEVIFLNDFRWSPQILPWHDLLLLLEGGLVHFPAPKTHFAKDLALEGDTPVFATSKHALIYIKGGVIDETETDMMTVRWKQFIFQSPIPSTVQRCVPPCGPCFAKFILHNIQL